MTDNSKIPQIVRVKLIGGPSKETCNYFQVFFDNQNEYIVANSDHITPVLAQVLDFQGVFEPEFTVAEQINRRKFTLLKDLDVHFNSILNGYINIDDWKVKIDDSTRNELLNIENMLKSGLINNAPFRNWNSEYGEVNITISNIEQYKALVANIIFGDANIFSKRRFIAQTIQNSETQEDLDNINIQAMLAFS